MLGSERAVADRGAPLSSLAWRWSPWRSSSSGPGPRAPRARTCRSSTPTSTTARRDWIEYPPDRILGILAEGGDQARARLEHARRRHPHPLRAGSQAHRADPAAVSHARRHRPLVAGPVGARLRAGAPAEEPRRAQGHRRVPPLRRADRHLRGQAHHRAGGAGEHLPPRALGRARDRRAVHDRAAPPGHLGARGHVRGPAGGRRAARPLPESLGGPGHPQRGRGPGRHARPGLARGVPPPSGPLPRRNRYLDDARAGKRCRAR